MNTLLIIATAVAETASEEPASTLEAVLTVGSFLLVIAVLIGLQLWSQRRRRRGEEASTSNSEGAEVTIPGAY